MVLIEQRISTQNPVNEYFVGARCERAATGATIRDRRGYNSPRLPPL